MSLGYSCLPVTSDSQRRELRRSLVHLRTRSAQIESIMGNRSFRLWALITLNALDLFTTSVVLTLGGSEQNPVMQPIIHQWWSPILVKAVILACIATATLRMSPKSKFGDGLLVLSWIFYLGVVGWNTLLLVAY